MASSKLYVSNSPESTRLFEAGWMEALSKVHFSVPLYVFIPVVAYSSYLAVANGISLVDFIAYGALGFLAWTAVEYVMHRFVFHFHPTSEIGKKLHFIFHGVHHDYPCDRLRLVLPPSVSIPLATGFFFLWRSFIPAPGLYAFFATFIIGYLIYDMFHYAIHHAEVKGKLWNRLKTHHLKHHYVDPDKGFGVSSPLWDIIVRSDFDPTKEKENKVEQHASVTSM